MPPKKTPQRGERIQLKGLHTTADMRAMLNEAIDQIEAVGITHVSGANFYFNPADKNGSRVFPRQYGRRVVFSPIEEPYRSAADEHGI
jgi:hypothetical protein